VWGGGHPSHIFSDIERSTQIDATKHIDLEKNQCSAIIQAILPIERIESIIISKSSIT
jgi:hypothetical protein